MSDPTREDRLRELAVQAALFNHDRCLLVEKNDHPHDREFEECLNPDCVLVRATPGETPGSGEDWRPIETAPKDGTPVELWWRGEYGPDVIDVWACGCWREFGDGSRGWVGSSFHASEPAFWTRLVGERPTHWRPLTRPALQPRAETPTAREDVSPAYRVEVDGDGCERCSAGKTWTVVGPDEVATSMSWEDEEDAIGLCDMLNDAYEKGRAVALPPPAEGEGAKEN